MSRCPICGTQNDCSMAHSGSRSRDEGKANNEQLIASCWCFHLQEQLDLSALPVPLDDSSRHCLCQSCFEKYKKRPQQG